LRNRTTYPAVTTKPPKLLFLQSNLELFLIILITYILACLFRLLEMPQWSSPSLYIDGEPLLVAHDAYIWLAGAKGTSAVVGHPFSEFLRLLQLATGQSLAKIGFWLPVFVAPLVVIPVCILSWKWNMPEAGLVAGILTASSIGFLIRTRLGYLDTDMIALFFPAVLAAGLVLWLSPICRPGWLRRSSPAHEQEVTYPSPQIPRLLSTALALGLLINLYLWFYASGQPIALALCGMAFLAGLFLCRPGGRIAFLTAFAVLAMAWLAGWPGIICAVGIALALYRYPQWAPHSRVCFVMWVLLALLILLTGQIVNIFFAPLEKILIYAKATAVIDSYPMSLLKVPAGMESNREALEIPFNLLIGGMMGHWLYFVLGLAGFVWLAWKRPLAICFLPFILLALSSVKLGNRFTMYAGIPWGLGLGCGLWLIMERFSQSKTRRYVAMGVLGLLLCLPIWDVAKILSPAPVLSKQHARTLSELKTLSAPDAELWQWWDFGYAAQYYAERIAFADGSRPFGFWLYLPAVVHATSSPLQARQMMIFMAKTRTAQERILKANREVNTRAKFPLYDIDPSLPFRSLMPEELAALVTGFANEPKKWPAGMREQYLTVSWDNLPLIGVISHYANWDFATGQGRADWIRKVSGKVDINRAYGHLSEDDQYYDLLSLDILDETGRKHFEWSHERGVRAIANQLTGEIYLMGNRIYSSIMIRMLIDDPRSFADHFEIVVDHYPWARSYRVKYP
jgi:dolichyl-diphosphooligosaccharide--protein glycosyltransferase